MKSKIKVQKQQIKRRDKAVSNQNEEIRSLKKSLVLRDSKIEELYGGKQPCLKGLMEAGDFKNNLPEGGESIKLAH